MPECRVLTVNAAGTRQRFGIIMYWLRSYFGHSRGVLVVWKTTGSGSLTVETM